MSERTSEAGGATRASTAPPPAPPLPPQSSTASLAANVIARFAQNINYGARVATAPYGGVSGSPTPGLSLPRNSRLENEIPSSSQDLREINPFAFLWKSPLVPAGLDRTTADKNNSPIPARATSHRTGIEIQALDISPCRTRAVLAGRDILKTVAIDDFTCVEDFNLRESIVRYATTHEPLAGRISAKHKDLLAAVDVKWSNGDFNTTIATAASNGQIVVYDLNRAGVELARLHEHTRQVHRIGFNPHRGNLLLSGSQDGTTRLWDLRALAGERSVMTCQSKSKYAGNSEGIRDLRWSPTNGVEFAVGSDNGVLQRWDIRKESSPSLKVNAHEKTVSSVDWHPDGKHLLSGGVDRSAKIWDFSSSDRRMKPAWEIDGPQSIFNARWRPASWSADGQSSGSWQCTQLATSYDPEEPDIHIWDLRRPFVPARIVQRTENPTDLLWHSEDLLWSVDKTGRFTQEDVKFAKNPMNGRDINPIAVSPNGCILFAATKPEHRRSSLQDVTNNLLSIERRESNRSGRSSAAQSSTPGSQEEASLLGSTFKNRRSKTPTFLKTTRSIDNSTPSPAGPEEAVTSLELSLQERNMFKLAQSLRFGPAPGGVLETVSFKFMARHYSLPPESYASNRSFNLHLVLGKMFNRNARIAHFCGKYRLAQTWRILAHAAERELGVRAEDNYQARQQRTTTQASEEANRAIENTVSGLNALSLPISTQQPGTSLPESGNRAEPIGSEADLNIHTSLLFPRPDKDVDQDQTIIEETSAQATRSDRIPVKDASIDQEQPAELNIYELERQIAEGRAAMDSYRAQPRPVLKLGDSLRTAEPDTKLKSSSQESNELFQMFSASIESSQKAKSMSESFDESEQSDPKNITTEEDMDNKTAATGHQKGVADSAMDFDDDASTVSLQDVPASPVSSTSSTKSKGKGKASPATEQMMTAVEVDVLEEHLTLLDDILKLDHTPPPLAETGDNDEHVYIESDFYPRSTPFGQDPDPPYKPWDITAMFMPMMDQYSNQELETPLLANLVLHLMPWLDLPYMTRSWAENVILVYHNRLHEHELFKEACEVRNYCEEVFGDTATRRLGDIGDTMIGGIWCTHCNKPSKGRISCERCHQKWDPCSICHGNNPTIEDRSKQIASRTQRQLTNLEANDTLWRWCDRCGHGGHVGCLRAFWEHSPEGSCATPGCLCDCQPGSVRNKLRADAEAAEKKASRPVAADSFKVGESSAVARARVTIGGVEARRGVLRGGMGQLVGEREVGREGGGRKKSVMFDIPDDTGVDKGKGKVYRRGGGGRGGWF